MPPDRPLLSTCSPHLQVMVTDDGSRTLRDLKLNETYHSGCGALLECLHVYLRNSGVEAQLRGGQPVAVLEIGFGTGLGWLITACAAMATGGRLQYVSLENALLPASIFQQLDGAGAVGLAIGAGILPEAYGIAAQHLQSEFWQRLATLSADTASLQLEVNQTKLDLLLVDAPSWLARASGQFDAIYFDAFSPGTSPALWQTELFQRVRSLLRAGGTLVSYCVNGQVRRQLQAAGFQVARIAGPPGGKREVLVARNVLPAE